MSSEVIRIIRMPFFIEKPMEFLRKHGVLVDSFTAAIEVLNVKDRVKEILESCILRSMYPEPAPTVSVEQEVIAFHTAALLLAWLGSRALSRRFAVAVGKYSGEYMRKLSDRGLQLASKLLDVDLDFNYKVRIPYTLTSRGLVYRELKASMSIRDYIRLSKRLKGDPKWKLTNQVLSGGRVFFLERSMIPRLLEEAVVDKVLGVIERYSEALKPGAQLPGELSELGDYVKSLASKTSAGGVGFKQATPVEGVVVYEAFPPCMKRIFEEAREGSNLSHHERFAIATFLVNIGAEEDEIVDLFRNLPDFNEKITRYQVEHLMGKRGSGKRYLTYSCETMKTLGLCIGECKVKNPLEAYRRNLRRLVKTGVENSIVRSRRDSN